MNGQLRLAGPHMYIDQNNKLQRGKAIQLIEEGKSETTAHAWIDFPAVTSLKTRASPTSATFEKVHNLTIVLTYWDQELERLQSVTYSMVDPHTNDQFFVRGALGMLIHELRSTVLPNLELLIVHSDGAAKHFRSKFLYYLICQLSKEFYLVIIWYYNAPGEGKGPPDEEGGLWKILHRIHIRNGKTITGFFSFSPPLSLASSASALQVDKFKER
jgi:hypothetical protein